MKKGLVFVAALSCLMIVGTADVRAGQYYRGGSGLGISVNFGNGYSNFGGFYNRGYAQPSYRGGYHSGRYVGYPVYRSSRAYRTPIYVGGYRGHSHFRGYSHRRCR